MEKHPFNPAGLQQLLAELYALPPADLDSQSQALLADPISWIQEHFQLTDSQQAYLAQLPVSMLAFLGGQGSFAISNKLPISLAQEGDPKDEGKLFTPKSRFQLSTDSEGRIHPTGDMTIQVTYGKPLVQF